LEQSFSAYAKLVSHQFGRCDLLARSEESLLAHFVPPSTRADWIGFP